MDTRTQSLIAWFAFAALALVLGVMALAAGVEPLLGVALVLVAFVLVGLGFATTRRQPQ